jgi:hypothetical protein
MGQMQSMWRSSADVANATESSSEELLIEHAHTSYGTNEAPPPYAEVERPGNAVAFFKLELEFGMEYTDVFLANLDLLHSALEARKGQFDSRKISELELAQTTAELYMKNLQDTLCKMTDAKEGKELDVAKLRAELIRTNATLKDQVYQFATDIASGLMARTGKSWALLVAGSRFKGVPMMVEWFLTREIEEPED